VKSSETAESYGVSGENFGGYNHLCSTQNMGSGKLSKRARRLAKCWNMLAQQIAARHRVLDLSLVELADLQSRFAEGGIPMPKALRLSPPQYYYC
jgi:hypothetical protein